ncbi:apolipoprotein N-acyltransferase (plasmid) [Legionella adelaidensis]|uniref:Apolipoprotein N-acyltransferase n=1 Tax=Legionella adelaidensis TaxID=45056 RepID=A0A0W0R455_9GAMM|nr:apolipoprotein N-acyltransferase [Legionella adelaidensis]KTC65860.1 apolipoprotein N-acyltransferase [Legionella adelaidensis]VEH85290.1 apolipoprotein N-acyltransferase [Legionella adelaidensis]
MQLKYSTAFRAVIPFFLAGLIVPLGFAPFHFPGLSILGVGILFYLLQSPTLKFNFLSGFLFGFAYFGLGVSWVYVSIRVYGHIHPLLSFFITLLFIFLQSFYIGLVTLFFRKIYRNIPFLFSCVVFSAIWCLGEFLRATILSGFPWLLLGFSQIETPLRFMIPVVGIYGVSFLACLTATFFVGGVQKGRSHKYIYTLAALFILLGPALLNKSWTTVASEPQKIGIIQANLSMRDKWDETIFWRLLKTYSRKIQELIADNDIIVLPESAFPVPPSYIADFLDELDKQAKQLDTSVLIGIPQAANMAETAYFNTMIALGNAEGTYLKQHLVPFGEYIPLIFQRLNDWLGLPSSNMQPGKSHQKPILVKERPIASLICYELAYPSLLRKQLPDAQWIASISDDGWFGHSFAMYQQLQMAQALSLQTGRYQVLANNDGLSSVINDKGEIVASLPAFKSKTLQASLYPAFGSTPWVYYGDGPVLLSCCFIIGLAVFSSYKFLSFTNQKFTLNGVRGPVTRLSEPRS